MVRGRHRAGRPRLRPRPGPDRRHVLHAPDHRAPARPCSTSTATAGSTSTCCRTAARAARRNQPVPPAARRHVRGRQRRLGPGRRRLRHGRGRRRRQQRRPARRLVTEYGGVRLFLNNGDGTLHRRDDRGRPRQPLWGTSAAFVDYDRDGWLDLVVVNYVDYDPSRRCTDAGGQARTTATPQTFPGTVDAAVPQPRLRRAGAVARASRT